MYDSFMVVSSYVGCVTIGGLIGLGIVEVIRMLRGDR